jgi:hypothetical protein
MTLLWSDTSDNETGFKIERSTSGGPFAQIATVAANSTSYRCTGLTLGVTYSFRVRATKADGDSAFSNLASAATW